MTTVSSLKENMSFDSQKILNKLATIHIIYKRLAKTIFSADPV